MINSENASHITSAQQLDQQIEILHSQLQPNEYYIKELGISIKNHKEGSFDWINTTKNVPKELKESIIEFKEKNACISKGTLRYVTYSQ